MSRSVEFETTIKSGLPVVVNAVLHRPEPDIGIFNWQPEITHITFFSGHEYKLDLSNDDQERLEQECLENME